MMQQQLEPEGTFIHCEDYIEETIILDDNNNDNNDYYHDNHNIEEEVSDTNEFITNNNNNNNDISIITPPTEYSGNTSKSGSQTTLPSTRDYNDKVREYKENSIVTATTVNHNNLNRSQNNNSIPTMIDANKDGDYQRTITTGPSLPTLTSDINQKRNSNNDGSYQDQQKANKKKTVLWITLLLVLLVGIVIGATCGAGLCTTNNSKDNNSNKESPVIIASTTTAPSPSLAIFSTLSPTTISSGPCGGGAIGNGICADTSQCCSQFGFCDTTDIHCDPETCISGPGCPRNSPDTTQSPPCGEGEVGNGLCDSASNCCSQFGFCGISDDHCDPATCFSGPGCPRNGLNTSTLSPTDDNDNETTVTTSSPAVIPSPSPISTLAPSLTAPCGDGVIGNGFCTDTSHCCSQFGFCDSTDAHCDPGTCISGPECPQNGLDNIAGTCGGGDIGNGFCADTSQCCSQFGFCDITDEHCDPETCYSGPGCPPNGI